MHNASVELPLVPELSWKQGQSLAVSEVHRDGDKKMLFPVSLPHKLLIDYAHSFLSFQLFSRSGPTEEVPLLGSLVLSHSTPYQLRSLALRFMTVF